MVEYKEQNNNDGIVLSIIIPCFNQGEFIFDAISSVKKCREEIYEIIIINDGSTEPLTQKVLASLSNRGYFVIDQSKQGPSKARNIGIEMARGRYILPLDADNKIRPDYITKGIEVLDKFPEVGVVYGNPNFFGDKTGIREVPDFDLNNLLIGNYIDTCAVFRKIVWENCGGYDINLPNELGYEDWEFWLHAVEKGWQFHHINEVLFDYRVHSNSRRTCNRTPENMRKVVHYICNKHLGLFIPKLADIIAGKEFVAFSAIKQVETYQSQLQAIQIELENSQSQSQQTQVEWERLKSQIPSTLAASQTTTFSLNDPLLVSICIPTYNGEDFIAEALSSALSQTYPQIEIIISDDGSTDRTVEFATSFQKKNSVNFTIFNHEQYGLVHNWNFCLSQAKGKYIKFLFQDDLLESNCLEEMVNLAEQDDEIGLVFSPREVFLSGEAESNPTCMAVYLGIRDLHKGWSDLKEIQLGQELLGDANLLQSPLNKIGEPSSVLIRKKVFETVGLFDPELCQLVDVDMWLRIMGHYKIGFVDKSLSSFRIHPRQQTHQNIHDKATLLLDSRNFYNKIFSNSCYNLLDSALKKKAYVEYTALNDKYYNLQKLIKCSKYQDEVVVSIIIACFNQGEFILDAVSSIESCQDAVYEVIIVNDGSTDSLTQKVLSYLENQGYFVIHQSNKGVAQARNAGIDIARGRYILPLDADNKIRELYIKKGIEILDEFPEVGVVYGNPEYFGEKTGIREVPEFDIIKLLKDNYIDTCAVFRKTVWQDCGGYEPCLEIQGHEDWDFWLCVAEKGWTFYHVPEVLFDYRVRAGSLSSRFRNPEIYHRSKHYIYSKHINLYTKFTQPADSEKPIELLQEGLEPLQVQQQQAQEQDVAAPIPVELTPKVSVSTWINYPSIEPIHERSHRPFWSVMIPTYNNVKYLQQTLKSVLDQDPGFNEMQIEVVDDCSTQDDIEAIVREIGQNRISYYKQPQNVGLSANWNTCIRRARGHWVHILHQDDIVLPGFYSCLREALEKESSIGAAFCRHAFIDEKGEQLFLSPFERETAGILSYWLERLAIECRIQCAAVVVKRSVYQELGGFHPELVYALDWDMWKRIAAHYSFWYEPQTLACYRLWHSSSESSRLMKSGANVADLRKSIEISQSYLPEMIAAELSNKAREHWAIGALNTAHQMLTVGDTAAAIAQLREALKCSDSPKVTRLLAFLLFQSPESDAFLAALSEQTKTDQPLPAEGANLRQSRKQIAQQWLSLSADQLESLYLGNLGKAHQELLNTSLRYEPLTDSEQSFVQELLANMAGERQHIAPVLAVMLYCLGYQLPMSYDLSQIPHWFLNDYLRFLLDSPPYFTQRGETERYSQYLQKFVNYLYESIRRKPESKKLQDIALFFTLNAKFRPLYLTTTNLKDIYTKRAEIMEFALSTHNHQIDYEFPNESPNRTKIRLGILQQNLQPQAETFALLASFEYLDKTQFEIILYAINVNGNPLKQYCQSCADRLVQLPNDLRGQVQTLRADDLDVLLIGDSVTGVPNAVTLLALHRLARVQVAGFTSPVTTGIRNIDYYLSGTLTETSQNPQKYYREKLITLEGTGFCFSYPQTQTPTIKTDRTSLGIPDRSVVFISCANYYKITPELRETWAKIVAQVPNAVLVLLPFNPSGSQSYPEMPFINQMRSLFAKYGIAKSRLLVLAALPTRLDVQEVLKLGDVYLDSYPYAGSAELVDALEVGLPTVVMEGNFLRSRTGSAIVRSLQMAELITDTETGYIRLAIALGTHPELRLSKRAKIQHKIQEFPVFLNSRAYAAQLGSVFKQLLSKPDYSYLPPNFGG